VYEQGARHKRQKRLCIPSFENSASMASFLEAVKEEVVATSADWTARLAAGEPRLDLYREMRRMTLSVVLRVTFGLGGAVKEYARADELSQVIGDYLEAIVATANEVPPLWQVAPRLSRNYVAVTETLLPRLRELVSDVIAQRRSDEGDDGRGSGGVSSDLLSVLVKQPGLSDEDIQYILFDLVIAGSDTTASTLTAAFFLLHEKPHAAALAAARKEAAAVDVGELALDEIRLALPYATAIGRETLRLYPPVPFIGRTSVADARVGAAMVPSGSTMCWSPYYLGREPTSWGSDADKFRPERWVDDPISGGAPSSFCWLPFGAGARGCLGTRLGLTEVVVGVSAFLRNFDFSFEREELKYKYDLTLNLENSCVCTIARREV